MTSPIEVSKIQRVMNSTALHWTVLYTMYYSIYKLIQKDYIQTIQWQPASWKATLCYILSNSSLLPIVSSPVFSSLRWEWQEWPRGTCGKTPAWLILSVSKLPKRRNINNIIVWCMSCFWTNEYPSIFWWPPNPTYICVNDYTQLKIS